MTTLQTPTIHHQQDVGQSELLRLQRHYGEVIYTDKYGKEHEVDITVYETCKYTFMGILNSKRDDTECEEYIDNGGDGNHMSLTEIKQKLGDCGVEVDIIGDPTVEFC